MEMYIVEDLPTLYCPLTINFCAKNRCGQTTETIIVIYFWLVTTILCRVYFLFKLWGSNSARSLV
jgi:hypothetical protein